MTDGECLTCGEGLPANECDESKRPCGHHCNCSWTQDVCHWCGVEFGEDPDSALIGLTQDLSVPS